MAGSDEECKPMYELTEAQQVSLACYLRYPDGPPVPVHVRVELSPRQAEALAQFVKRVGFSDLRVNAAHDEEAYLMRDALDRIRTGLADAGYAPR